MYEKPRIREVGSVRELTQGEWFADGQDKWTWVNKIAGIQLFGS